MRSSGDSAPKLVTGGAAIRPGEDTSRPETVSLIED